VGSETHPINWTLAHDHSTQNLSQNGRTWYRTKEKGILRIVFEKKKKGGPRELTADGKRMLKGRAGVSKTRPREPKAGTVNLPIRK